jgi:hypothetical protein
MVRRGGSCAARRDGWRRAIDDGWGGVHDGGGSGLSEAVSSAARIVTLRYMTAAGVVRSCACVDFLCRRSRIRQPVTLRVGTRFCFAFAECGRAPQRCALGVCHNVDVCSAVYMCPDVRMSHCAYVRQFSCVTTPCHDVSTCMWRVRVCVCVSFVCACCARPMRSPFPAGIQNRPPGYARAGRARCNCVSESGGNEPRRSSRMLAKGVKRDSPPPLSHPLCIGSVDIARRQSCASKHSYRPRLA